MIYNTLKVITIFRSITFPAAHLPPLILNYRIIDLGWDFKDSHGNEVEIIDVLEISGMSWDNIHHPRDNRDTVLLHLDPSPEHLLSCFASIT
jgi:hypothetical protein